jgi:hypothetical protein
VYGGVPLVAVKVMVPLLRPQVVWVVTILNIGEDPFINVSDFMVTQLFASFTPIKYIPAAKLLNVPLA